MAADVGRVMNTIAPCWERDIHTDLPGNFLAGELKKIHDSSRSVLPDSVHSEPAARRQRWRSIYVTDYVPLGKVSKGNAQKKAAADKKDTDPSSKMFMKWKVPARMLEESSSSRGSPTKPPERSVSPRKDKSDTLLPTINSAMPKVACHPSATARTMTRPHTTASRLAVIPGAEKTRRNDQMSQSARFAREDTGRSLSPKTPLKKSKSPPIPKGCRTKEVMKNFQVPVRQTYTTAEEWFANADAADRNMVEKAIKLVTKEKEYKTSSDTAVYDSLQTASEQDRAMAIKFFQTLTGSTLLGDTTPGQQERLRHITNILNKGKPVAWRVEGTVPEQSKDSRLRYIRLLTPTSRRMKWMYQTWHHLPTHQQSNPLFNNSAIYTQPQKPIPRHFVIHPDWG